MLSPLTLDGEIWVPDPADKVPVTGLEFSWTEKLFPETGGTEGVDGGDEADEDRFSSTTRRSIFP